MGGGGAPDLVGVESGKDACKAALGAIELAGDERVPCGEWLEERRAGREERGEGRRERGEGRR